MNYDYKKAKKLLKELIPKKDHKEYLKQIFDDFYEESVDFYAYYVFRKICYGDDRAYISPEYILMNKMNKKKLLEEMRKVNRFTKLNEEGWDRMKKDELKKVLKEDIIKEWKFGIEALKKYIIEKPEEHEKYMLYMINVSAKDGAFN